MKAEIVAIGTEILLGEIIDTNSAHIASRLPELGIDLNYKSVVGDNMDRVVGTLQRAWDRSDLIIITGGLGPTDDDMTREGVAALVGEIPAIDPELEERLRSFFARVNYQMPESNLKQAWLIPSARALDNPRGTAPGWWVEKDGRIIVCMPGVPPEMEMMWANEVAPELARRSTGEVLVTRTLKTLGIGEGTVDDMARPLYSLPGIGIGTYARQDGVHLRIGAKGATKEEAWSRVRPVEEEMDRIFGDAIWGKDDDTLDGVVSDLLRERQATLSVMESCTGGLFASKMTDNPGASSVFVGGLVTYQTDQKIAAGVPEDVIREFGVISSETALEMARAIRERMGTTYGLGITGVLGPEDVEGNPPGTVHIGIVTPTRNDVIRSSMNQGRTAIKQRSLLSAMLLLRRAILSEGQA